MTHNDPNIPYDVDTIRKISPSSRFWPLFAISIANLIKRQRDDDQAQDGVQVILWWAPTRPLGLDPMNDSTEHTLYDVEHK